MSKVLVASVGGSPEPVIYSIEHQQPEYIIYFVSQETRKEVWDKIEPQLNHKPQDRDIVVTKDSQDLVASVRTLLQQVPSLLTEWEISLDQVIGEFTGGTKAMSSALVLVLSEYGAIFTYVGGEKRDKDGLGVVIGGNEKMFHLANPWEELAIRELREIEDKFNSYQFSIAQEKSEQTAERTEKMRSFFKALANVCQAYSNWDKFQHNKAINLLNTAYGIFQKIEGFGHESISEFKSQLDENLSFLKKVEAENNSLLERKNSKGICADTEQLLNEQCLIRDLLANATRRAEQERYDDAVARIYGAVEKIAKIKLKFSYNIDNSRVYSQQIPEGTFKNDLFQNNKFKEPFKLPLQKSFDLLIELNDSVGKNYKDNKDELRSLLEQRNNSMLAHGYKQITKDTYEKMLNLALDFLNFKQDNLPEFAKMNWRGLGYDDW